MLEILPIKRVFLIIFYIFLEGFAKSNNYMVIARSYGAISINLSVLDSFIEMSPSKYKQSLTLEINGCLDRISLELSIPLYIDSNRFGRRSFRSRI